MPKALKSLLAAVLALSIALPALAQQPPALAETWSMVPKAEHRAKFFEGLKAHMAFRTEAGDPWVWKTYTPMLGDDLDPVIVRACCFGWADLDSYREWSEANPEVNANFQENVGQYTESYGHFLNRIAWNDSNTKGDWSSYRYFAVTDFSIKSGMGGEFDAAREALSQIAINNGWATEDRPWVWSTSIGGTPSESLVVPYARFADMAPPEKSFFDFLVGVMGSEEAANALFARLTSAIDEQEYQIWELHEDFSMKSPE